MPKDYPPDQTAGWRPRTKLVRGGLARSAHGETSEALYLTSGYAYDSAEQAMRRFRQEEEGFVYSRFANPTVEMFQKRMALLENADEARATATGMAAVFAALMCQLRAGDHVLSSRAVFGSVHVIISEILPRYGIETTEVDGTDLSAWRAAVRPNTKVVLLETPSNPMVEVIDIASVAEIAHQAGARLVVDNVFATPILQRPMEMGADIIVYSTTKHIDGQGRTLGGAILADAAFIADHLAQFLRHTGPALSPFNAWVLLKGLETLDLRVREHARNAARIADFLADQPGITRLLYPARKDHPQHALAARQMEAGGSIVTFDIEGGREGAFRFLNALRLIDISNNLGDTKSLITHPATTTHQRLTEEEREALGILPGTVRMSVGLEDPADLEADLSEALAAARG